MTRATFALAGLRTAQVLSGLLTLFMYLIRNGQLFHPGGRFTCLSTGLKYVATIYSQPLPTTTEANRPHSSRARIQHHAELTLYLGAFVVVITANSSLYQYRSNNTDVGSSWGI